MSPERVAPWDLTALLNAADPKAGTPERHLWLVRLMEWLRHAPTAVEASVDPRAAPPPGPGTPGATPAPVLRLRHLLGVLDRHPQHKAQVSALLHRFWSEVDSVALFADFGFAPRMDLWRELGRRLRARVLPRSPATDDLGELFPLLFPHADDADWLLALDAATLTRLQPYIATTAGDIAWREPFVTATTFLASAVRASGFSPALRLRMSPLELPADEPRAIPLEDVVAKPLSPSSPPFMQLARVAEAWGELALGVQGRTTAEDEARLLRELQYLRALLDACRRSADSVHEHLELHGVSVDLVFEVDQLIARTHRIEALLTCIVSPEPAREVCRLLAELVRVSGEERSIRALLARHYSLLARQVAERSAETGEHYITRDRAAHRAMLFSAAGGGVVMAGTTFVKFGVLALGLSAFWGGFWAGMNYAASFLLVQRLHFTVATKQPAMTAPTMAAKLTQLGEDAHVEAFVDEVAHLIRSQIAGIVGNLALVAPVVLAVQFACRGLLGTSLVGHHAAQHVLHSLTLLGPTALFAAITGVLLFASSLVAGWVENWYVWHRLDSAIAWNPRIVDALGAARAQRWSNWWRSNVSGVAANVSLGLMLGLVPAVATFFGLPLEVRHVTLSTGQLAAALGAEGFALAGQPVFWWCAAGIAATGVLNLGVSFSLAFAVALRSRGLRVAERSRITRAILARVRSRPGSFLWPDSQLPASQPPGAR